MICPRAACWTRRWLSPWANLAVRQELTTARDHWPRCYFSLWAGGGVQPGRTIGESDKYAEDPVTTAITPLMVGTTICELAGLDTQARAEMRVLDGGTVIQDLLYVVLDKPNQLRLMKLSLDDHVTSPIARIGDPLGIRTIGFLFGAIHRIRAKSRQSESGAGD